MQKRKIQSFIPQTTETVRQTNNGIKISVSTSPAKPKTAAREDKKKDKGAKKKSSPRRLETV
jgi:uncharacterized lipoprotein YddW (UPF0748 family)